VPSRFSLAWGGPCANLAALRSQTAPVMAYQFRKHYTRDEARALLPKVRGWLNRLRLVKEQLDREEPSLSRLLAEGADLGGQRINHFFRLWADLQLVFREFRSREIQIKDLDRGLIDFPALIGSKEVFLCWENGEEDIEYWHDLDSGYAGRAPL